MCCKANTCWHGLGGGHVSNLSSKCIIKQHLISCLQLQISAVRCLRLRAFWFSSIRKFYFRLNICTIEILNYLCFSSKVNSSYVWKTEGIIYKIDNYPWRIYFIGSYHTLLASTGIWRSMVQAEVSNTNRFQRWRIIKWNTIINQIQSIFLNRIDWGSMSKQTTPQKPSRSQTKLHWSRRDGRREDNVSWLKSSQVKSIKLVSR